MNPFEDIGSPENPENNEDIGSMENSLEVPLSFVEKHESKTPEILGNFFSKLNFKNYTILEINTTRKSIYGSVEVENKKLFYKISKAESILQELQGYKIASEYPHEEVIKHHFEDDYGVFLQTFSLNMEKPETLLAGTINKSLLIKSDKEIDSILAQTEQTFSTMGDLYLDGLTKSPLTLNGPNDIFF